MHENKNLSKQWENLVTKLSLRFSEGDPLQIDAVLYLIGVQELGQGFRKFSRDDKINLMHIAICRILVPFGYYAFSHHDKEAWPHYKIVKKLPVLNTEQQSLLMQKAIIRYFEDETNLDIK